MLLKKSIFCGALGLTLAVSLVFLSGCGDQLDNFCNPLSQTSATVVMQGEANIRTPAPVTLNGVSIGEVTGKSLDDSGRAMLNLCLDHGQAEKLNKLTVFYVEQSPQGEEGKERLICQIFPDEAAPTNENMRFLGFESYTDFLSWRAQGIVKKGLDGLLNALDEALDSATSKDKK